MFRTGVANLLALEPEFELAGEANDGEEAVLQAGICRPDVIVMDIHLPKLDGMEATKEILGQYPDMKILALTSYDDGANLESMLKAGARGYVLKEGPIEELVLAIKLLASGSSYFAKEIATKLSSLFSKPLVDENGPQALITQLTTREIEVLKCIVAEMTNKEIAQQLFISQRTVESHRSSLLQKLKVKNTAGLIKAYLAFSGNSLLPSK